MTNTPANITTKVTGKVPTLTPEQKKLCDDTAAHIRRFDKAAKTAIVQIGAKLIKVKNILGHGDFGKWLKSEVGYTERTAQNYMNAARAFGDKYEIVSYLPVATTYQLAAMPDDKRTEIVSLIKDPQNPPVKVIKDKIGDFKNAEKMAKLKEASESKLSPAAKKAREAKRKKEEAEWKALQEKREREEAETRKKILALVAKMNPDTMTDLSAILKRGGVSALQRELEIALSALGGTEQIEDAELVEDDGVPELDLSAA